MAGSEGTSSDRLGRARLLKWLVLAVVIAAVVVLLFQVVFPWFESNYYDPSIG